MKKLVGQEILDSFINITPYLNQLILLDIAVGVYDREQVLAYAPGETLNTFEEIGQKITAGGSVERAIKEGKPQLLEVPKEVYGVPFKALCLPVFDRENKVLGAVAIGTSLDNQLKLEQAVDNFSLALGNVQAHIKEIASGADEVNKINYRLDTGMSTTIKELKNSDEILAMVRSLANKSKLLGLNASIEAYRVGEAGRGFTIVAQEIQKLSENSSQSVGQVGEILKSIGTAITDIGGVISESNQVSNQQKRATQEIQQAIEQLTATIDDLKQLAKII